MFTFIPYLEEIINCQNLTIAAKKLNISQPALSTALRKAEEQLGAPIFDRSQKPWRLTEVGYSYYNYGLEYNNHVDELKRKISDMRNLKKGKLRIGGSILFNTTCLPQAIAAFTQKYPEIQLSLIDGTVPEMLDKLIKGEIDLYFTPNFIQSEYVIYEKIFCEKILLCVPKEYEINLQLERFRLKREDIVNNRNLPSEEKISLALFEKYPFILLQESQQIGQIFRQLLKEDSVYPSKVIYTDQMATSLALTNEGLGISLISETAILYGNFDTLPNFYLPNSDICYREMGVGYHSQRYLSSAAKEFIQIIKKINYNN